MERNTPPFAVSNTAHRKGLYPDNEPFAYGWLPTGGTHEIFYEECGNPDGKPCVILHGGPGGAINPTMRRFFNPAKWRMALFDQRGCGKSRPNASLEDNTTWSLIEDIERLRIHLGVEKWTVFGGSWGSTLALAYAITHPHRVEALVLRGIFLLTQRELRWFYQDGASMIFPDAWERFVAPIPEAERGDMIAAYHRRLFCGDTAREARFALPWLIWENALAGLEISTAGHAPADYARAFARLENHYFANGCFLEDNQLLRNRHLIEHIPAVIVQGRYDMVCPPDAAWELAQGWDKAELRLVPASGHALSEPRITAELVRVMDVMRHRVPA